MKKVILLFAAIATLSVTASAQEAAVVDKKNHIAVGMNINSFGGDFGLGINVTSPTFFDNHMAVKVSGNYQWLDHIDAGGDHTWTGYTLFRAGLMGVNMSLSEVIELYGEGGLALALTDNSLSTESSTMGGYGLFGFEFFMPANMSYFIELGGMGLGAKADKVATSPLIANGFMASVGFRVRL